MKATRDRVAVYVRDSTLEQDLDGQRRGLLEEVERRGWTVGAVYAETRSSGRERPELERMHKAAMRREHDAVVVWRLDRLGRGLLELVGRVRELHERGVQVVSVRDGAIDTTTAAGQFQLATLAAAAEYERELIRERTREALARKRAAGVRLGRPPVDERKLEAAIAELMDLQGRFPWGAGAGVRQVAAKHGIGATTLRRYLERRAKKGGPENEAPSLDERRGLEVVR